VLTEVGVEEWPFIAATIEPAIDSPTLAEVYEALTRHHVQAFRAGDGAAGYVVTKTAYVKGTAVPAMWLLYASGKVFGPARPRMLALARELEQIALSWGCNETRITGGRVAKWRRVLTDYDPIEGGIRKVLHG
jgi:hypothetical protein